MTPPVSRPGRAAVAGALLLAVGIALGVYVVGRGAEATGELSIDVYLSQHRTPLLVGLAHFLAVALGPVVAPFVVATIAMIVAQWNRWSATMLAAGTAIGWLAVALLKPVYARPRPPADQVNALEVHTGLTSFPSGHTAIATALLGGALLGLHVAGRPTRWAWLLGVPGVLLMAASRMYLGVHYLGDVVGAMLIASGTVLLFAAAVSRSIRSQRHRASP